MNNIEKASIILLALDEEIAASVMKHLRSDEIRRLGSCMNRLENISSEDMSGIAKEFFSVAMESGRGIISVERDKTKNLITKALGEENAREVLDMLEDEGFRPYQNPVIDKLQNIDPKVLVEFTKMEHPQTIALILVHLKPEQAAEMLETLPIEKQKEIVRRIANLRSVPHEVIDEMTKALEGELVSGPAIDQQIGGVHVMADILNRMSRSSEHAILEMLDEQTPDLATEIRNLMFTFDDIFKVDDRGIRELLKEIDRDDLVRALKVVDKSMSDKIYRNMSGRAAEMLREDIELMPPTRLSEVERSQRNIVEVTKRLESEGRIVLSRGEEEDVFV